MFLEEFNCLYDDKTMVDKLIMDGDLHSVDAMKKLADQSMIACQLRLARLISHYL